MASEFEDYIDEFEQLCQKSTVSHLATWLESRSLPVQQRAHLLVELIAVDLEYTWKRMHPIDLESEDVRLAEWYFQEFPETSDGSERLQIIVEEFIVRQRWGDQPPIESYRFRFANGWDELQPMLEQSLRELLQEVSEEERADSLALADTSLDHNETAPRHDPEFIGRFRVIKVLGRGGMATVYLAEDRNLNRLVAIKVPHFENRTHEHSVRWLNEARAAAAIRHPNVCPVFEVGEDPEFPYLCMAYIEGCSLNMVIQEAGPLSTEEAKRIISKTAEALNEVHRQGTLHRDLKPGNIIIDQRGEPILLDFGLTHLIPRNESSRLTQQGQILGTPAYMAPEQVEGDVSAIGIATDVYGLGATYYELLAGQPPFTGSPARVLGAIVTNDPTPIEELRPDLDHSDAQVIQRMMNREPQKRFQTMANVIEALHSDRPAPPTRRSYRWAAGFLITALVLLLVASIRFQDPHGTIRILVQDPDLTVSVKEEHVVLSRDPMLVQVSPEQHVLTISQGPHGIESEPFIVRRGEETLVEVKTVNGQIQVSANGTELSRHSFPRDSQQSIILRSDSLLAAHWDFDSFEDGIIKDVSGHGLHAALSPTTTETSRLTKGVLGDALKFNVDGEHQSMDILDPFRFPVPELVSGTFSVWFRSDTPREAMILEAKLKSRRSTLEVVFFPLDGEQATVHFMLRDEHASQWDTRSEPPLPLFDGKWHHLAITWNAQTLSNEFYIDGQQVSSAIRQRAEPYEFLPFHTIKIGNSRETIFGDRSFAGALDDLRIYHGELAPEALRELFTLRSN
ncbi:MAG: protein kinase [Planctomycetaceae bacterium]|nr:protein kinase [Planctomycetaceae bacterium]